MALYGVLPTGLADPITTVSASVHLIVNALSPVLKLFFIVLKNSMPLCCITTPPFLHAAGCCSLAMLSCILDFQSVDPTRLSKGKVGLNAPILALVFCGAWCKVQMPMPKC